MVGLNMSAVRITMARRKMARLLAGFQKTVDGLLAVVLSLREAKEEVQTNITALGAKVVAEKATLRTLDEEIVKAQKVARNIQNLMNM